MADVLNNVTEYVVKITENWKTPEVILQSKFSRILAYNGSQEWLNANG